VRGKRYVLKIMKIIGGQAVQDLYKIREDRRKQEFKNKHDNIHDEINPEGYQFTKLIISPNNFYNMIKNDITLLLFVIYAILMPYNVTKGPNLSRIQLKQYMGIFDWFFIFDRTMDLFVGFYNENGSLETNVFKVIQNNISYVFFLELLISFGPDIAYKWFFPSIFLEPEDLQQYPSMVSFLFKVFRYIRIFEIENQIKEILDYYSKEWTVFEIKKV
jgi:hypothetical protein|tara:strand:+ start:643 stop:1293 length:651 start_codon:yes stop_codon:yes gene_type:complete